MDKLIAQLRRLYLPRDEVRAGVQADALARRLQGEAGVALDLAAPDGRVRALAMRFDRVPKAEADEHWNRLCTAANALQAELGLPAPGVSIDGEKGYCLWLSLASPVAPAQAREFLALLRLACFPESKPVEEGAAALPPCLNERSGKWAAFIHPGMGASFADDPGLDMTPPPAGQAAFLEGLESIGDAQFKATLAQLRQAHGPVPAIVPPPPAPVQPAAQPAVQTSDTLLLKDATLEDIVRFLHARNIEPTFRHLLPK